jgi:hypothetical protein
VRYGTHAGDHLLAGGGILIGVAGRRLCHPEPRFEVHRAAGSRVAYLLQVVQTEQRYVGLPKSAVGDRRPDGVHLQGLVGLVEL